jgi:hypothetical protein
VFLTRRSIAAILEGLALTMSAGRLRFPVRLLRAPWPFVAGPLIAPHPFGEAPPLLVARDVEPCARIAMRSARPPILTPPFCSTGVLGRARFFRRGPQASAREPHHHRIGMLALELLERRDEVVAILRAESRGLPLDDDCPVGKAWGHGGVLTLPGLPTLPTLNSTGG